MILRCVTLCEDQIRQSHLDGKEAIVKSLMFHEFVNLVLILIKNIKFIR
jgi:hypothetical protein